MSIPSWITSLCRLFLVARACVCLCLCLSVYLSLSFPSPFPPYFHLPLLPFLSPFSSPPLPPSHPLSRFLFHKFIKSQFLSRISTRTTQCPKRSCLSRKRYWDDFEASTASVTKAPKLRNPSHNNTRRMNHLWSLYFISPHLSGWWNMNLFSLSPFCLSNI